MNSLELMKLLTKDRKPSITYVKGENYYGSSVYILSEKQNNWLLNVLHSELKEVKNVPKDWNPSFGTQRMEGDTSYVYTTIKRNRNGLPAIRVANYSPTLQP